MPATSTPHLSAKAAHAFLESLPVAIQAALVSYATATDYPVEAVLEMAVAGFLDPDSLSFTDCNPLAVVKELKTAA